MSILNPFEETLFRAFQATYKKPPKTAGYKKDLLVAMFCSSLLVVAEEDFADDEVINVETDMTVNQSLLWLSKEIQTTLNNSDDNTKAYIQKKTRVLVPRALSVADGVVNLELLAMYIMFANFVERKQKLDEDLQFLAEFDYMEVASYLCEKTKVGSVEAEMYEQANRILEQLR